MKVKLGARLLTAASFLRGVPLVDVGSDHGYLPVFAVTEKGVPSAVAADISEGSLRKIVKIIEENSLSDRISAVLSDGFDSIIFSVPCDVVVAGMGGELIAKIISKEERLKNAGVRLILQPMTKSDSLRRYLTENGYGIIAEKVCFEDKYYEIIVAEYSGDNYSYTDEECLTGRISTHGDIEMLKKFSAERKGIIEKNAAEKSSAGHDVGREKRLIAHLDGIINHENN